MRTVRNLACILVLGLCVGSGAPAVAEPGHWRVTGVAADDVLNVRAAPSAEAEVIGALPPGARAVEVAVTDAGGRWGRIVWMEDNGWVAMRHLAPDPQPVIAATPLPAGLLCTGVEPFWSLRLDREGARFDDIAGAEAAMPRTAVDTAEGYRTPVLLSHAGPEGELLAIVAAADCRDGMADQILPWRAELLLVTDAGRRLLTGCCRLPAQGMAD